MTTGPHPICLHCKRYDGGAAIACEAYPDRIPDAIFFESKVDHRMSYEGDKGLQFDAEDAEGEKYAAELFSDLVPTSGNGVVGAEDLSFPPAHGEDRDDE